MTARLRGVIEVGLIYLVCGALYKYQMNGARGRVGFGFRVYCRVSSLSDMEVSHRLKGGTPTPVTVV